MARWLGWRLARRLGWRLGCLARRLGRGRLGRRRLGLGRRLGPRLGLGCSRGRGSGRSLWGELLAMGTHRLGLDPRLGLLI